MLRQIDIFLLCYLIFDSTIFSCVDLLKDVFLLNKEHFQERKLNFIFKNLHWTSDLVNKSSHWNIRIPRVFSAQPNFSAIKTKLLSCLFKNAKPRIKRKYWHFRNLQQIVKKLHIFYCIYCNRLQVILTWLWLTIWKKSTKAKLKKEEKMTQASL